MKRPSKMRRPEQALHIAAADFLTRALRAPTWWSSIDHAAKLGPVAASMRKRRGVKAGISDILVIHPESPLGHAPLVVWIELKSEAGEQSDPQMDFEEAMLRCGCLYYIARSLDEIEGFLKGVGIPLHIQMTAKSWRSMPVVAA
jgi:hypothetical protein